MFELSWASQTREDWLKSCSSLSGSTISGPYFHFIQPPTHTPHHLWKFISYHFSSETISFLKMAYIDPARTELTTAQPLSGLFLFKGISNKDLDNFSKIFRGHQLIVKCVHKITALLHKVGTSCTIYVIKQLLKNIFKKKWKTSHYSDR